MEVRIGNYRVRGRKGDWDATEIKVHRPTTRDGGVNEKEGQEYDGETNHFSRMHQAFTFVKGCLVGQVEYVTVDELLTLIRELGIEMKEITDRIEEKMNNGK